RHLSSLLICLMGRSRIQSVLFRLCTGAKMQLFRISADAIRQMDASCHKISFHFWIALAECHSLLQHFSLFVLRWFLCSTNAFYLHFKGTAAVAGDHQMGVSPQRADRNRLWPIFLCNLYRDAMPGKHFLQSLDHIHVLPAL